MRRLVWLFVITTGLFCGWWVMASLSVKSSVETWFDARRSEGWQADLTEVRTSGFPYAITTVLESPVLADPETGLAIEVETLSLSARTLWPGDVRVDLPSGPIQLATPDATGKLWVDAGKADLNLAPGAALELENLSYISGPFRMETRDGGLFAGDTAELRMVQAATADTYDLTMSIGQFAPGSVPRTALSIPENWPLVFTALQATAQVRFDRTWDRRALEQRRPQLERIDLANAEAHWGDVRLRLTGALDVDSAGQPSGDITIKAENWQSMLKLAEVAGLLPSDMRATVESVLTSLAAGSGKTDDLDITLTLGGGLTRIGFLPIGPAPRLILR